MDKLLLIAPPFHDYPTKIAEAIENNLEIKVDYVPECFYTKTFNILKYTSNLLKKRYAQQGLKKRLETKLYSKDEILYKYLFIIRGEIISEEIISDIKNRNPGIKTIFYNWDSFKENPNSKDILGSFDDKYSFDIHDCEENSSLNYKPLFFINKKNDIGNKETDIDLFFLGIDHSNRWNLIEFFKKYAKARDLRFKSFLITSKFSYYRKKLLNKRYRNAVKDHFKFSLIPYSDFTNYLSRSSVVLDISNNVQTGLTMRTFEALGHGKKLITTNSYIKNEPFYNENVICVINDTDIQIPSDFFKKDVDSESLFEKYEINNWVKEFFENVQ